MTVMSESHVELYYLPKLDFHRCILEEKEGRRGRKEEKREEREKKEGRKRPPSRRVRTMSSSITYPSYTFICIPSPVLCCPLPLSYHVLSCPPSSHPPPFPYLSWTFTCISCPHDLSSLHLPSTTRPSLSFPRYHVELYFYLS
jgi:hypothetical protein